MIEARPKKIYRSLYLWVIVAIITGILLGYFFPSFAVKLKPLGDGFIKLVKMMIAPVIFCTIVTGISGMQNMKKVGTVGVKALLYFEVLTTVALVIGLVAMNLIRPGEGMNVDASKLDYVAVNNVTTGHKPQSV